MIRYFQPVMYFLLKTDLAFTAESRSDQSVAEGNYLWRYARDYGAMRG